MNLIKKMVQDGWSVEIWPHYEGVSVAFTKGGEREKWARRRTLKQAVKAALK